MNDPQSPYLIGYIRVSSRQQHERGLGERVQREAIEAYVKANGQQVIRWFSEVGSATRDPEEDERKKLFQAIRECQKYGAALIVWDFDRITRNEKLCGFLKEANVPLISATSGPIATAVIDAKAAAAAVRGKHLSNAAKKTHRRRRKEGKQVGNPEGLRKARQVAAQRKTARGQRRANRVAAYIQHELLEPWKEKHGTTMPLSKIAEGLAKRGYDTARGGKWDASQVRSILRQAGIDYQVSRGRPRGAKSSRTFVLPGSSVPRTPPGEADFS
ncbi:recombinase family protein [Ferrovibrio sp.]|uniref:recombinase family protein n=1 Tax=Ferrovibrio sp. TaxID=1917215 RepID=UPI00260F907F|nr:recombinase family protein [Ferrovibrio sp.]